MNEERDYIRRLIDDDIDRMRDEVARYNEAIRFYRSADYMIPHREELRRQIAMAKELRDKYTGIE